MPCPPNPTGLQEVKKNEQNAMKNSEPEFSLHYRI
jgi:hypothetical protein